MSPRMASLRQRHTSAALTAYVVLAALVWAGGALGAGGAPLPAPDDPPSSQPAAKGEGACGEDVDGHEERHR